MNLNLTKSEIESILGWADCSIAAEENAARDMPEEAEVFKAAAKDWRSIKRKCKRLLSGKIFPNSKQVT